jgi:hypothetical protein
MSNKITNTRELLARAGLEDEVCPLCGDGHMNYAKRLDCFVCSLCGEVFPTGEALRNWARTSEEIKKVVEAMEEEDAWWESFGAHYDYGGAY